MINTPHLARCTTFQLVSYVTVQCLLHLGLVHSSVDDVGWILTHVKTIRLFAQGHAPDKFFFNAFSLNSSQLTNCKIGALLPLMNPWKLR